MMPAARAVAPSAAGRNRRLLLLLLIELCLLNIADFTLTRYGMWLGFATESNGIMDFFFRHSDISAAVFKFSIVTGGAVALWRLRRHRAALVGGALITGIFAAVVVYQILWLISL